MIKYIIFDMDGVLIDSGNKHANAWKKALKEYNINISNHELRLNEGSSQKLYLNNILKNNNIKLNNQEKEKLIAKKDLFFKRYKIVKYPILKEIKKFKDKGIKIAIGSGSKRIIVESVLKIFNNLFDEIISGDDVKKGKPNPETYNKAVNMLKANKHECLVIENAPLGIKSAKDAGLKVYAIETTLNKKYLKEADKIFKNHKELFKYINKNDV